MTSNKVINISSVNKYNDCKNKCDLSFKYPISTCIATNKITSIGIKYDNTGTPPVTFNNKKYNINLNHSNNYKKNIMQMKQLMSQKIVISYRNKV